MLYEEGQGLIVPNGMCFIHFARKNQWEYLVVDNAIELVERFPCFGDGLLDFGITGKIAGVLLAIVLK
ncbi:MAG TPA: hypothetical protein VMT64_08935, partial [Candidatus Binataceae bacterium]|nr:hypothetical protein [Candidatus Binataceae bacterium]